MGSSRCGWAGLCRRYFLSPKAADTLIQQGNSTSPEKLFRHRSLYSFSYIPSKVSDGGTMAAPLIKRCIHATGFCCSSERDYYKILGVPKDATRAEIKKAFHELAKKYHPDANKNMAYATRKFHEIRNAYETLQDPQKRSEYDQIFTMGAEDVKTSAGGSEEFRYSYTVNFSDNFHKIFSEIFESETEKFATDIQVELLLTLGEAAKGCTKDLSFDSYIPCDTCNGQGYPLGSKPSTCPTCEGIGKITIPPFTSTCHSCKGAGQVIKRHCMTCGGSGVVEGVKELKVTIPEGVLPGSTIHVPKAGNSGLRGNQPGGLYIKIKVAEDAVFNREGADVYVDANISFTQAILGGNVEVPTLFGKLQVKIPKKVQHGQLLALRGKGFPKFGFFKDHGDQYVRFRINFPRTITERQRALIEEFAREGISNGTSTSVEHNWWLKILERACRDSVLQISVFLLMLLLLQEVMG